MVVKFWFVGTLSGFQLPAANQLDDPAPASQFLRFWAYVETVDAVKSAIAASNLEETNLPPARARDAVSRRGRVERS